MGRQNLLIEGTMQVHSRVCYTKSSIYLKFKLVKDADEDSCSEVSHFMLQD